MGKPVIGITAGRRNHFARRGSRQMVTVGCTIEYVDSVVRSGGAPVLLPRVGDKEAVASFMRSIDALLLAGGGDVVSLAYGEQPHPLAKYQDPILDAMEFEAVHLAMEADMPILGVCRGIQSLNVALGGTLIQDINEQIPGSFQHFTHEREVVLAHTIDIEPGSMLADVLGITSTAVNSWHHQAVKDVADGLKANCRARDGVIEGLEAADGRAILAVQCHPEDCCEGYPLFQKLFDWIVAEAGRRAARAHP
jgi:putative glutamine amidotransferase